MAEECFVSDDPDEKLYEVLLDLLEAGERGQAPDVDEVVARHPELAPELREFLETRDRVETLTAPLRWVARAVLDSPPLAAGVDGGTPDGSSDIVPGPAVGARLFGDYVVLERLGRGGMCVVYKARHRTLNRTVALKTVRGSRLSDEDAQRRFRNEAETVAALDHPNIVPIYEVDAHAGQLFFTMKLLDGGSLKDRLEDFPGDPRKAARLMATVARAVAYAHSRGVLHRDLKPSNVLLDAAGQPHVADFGLAKWLDHGDDLTQTGALLGTPSYMAPEQASPDPRPRPGAGPGPGRGPHDGVTTAADVYGLGAVLYALLTGRPPFCGPTLLRTLDQVREDAPTPPRATNPRVDVDLETVCLTCLEKDPARRYRSAEELAEDLERWLRHEPVRAHRPTLARRLWLVGRRHPAWTTLAAAVTVFVPALIATLATAVVSVGHERDRATAREAQSRASERHVRRQLYAADMAQAYRNWRHGDVNGLKHLLLKWQDPPDGDDPRDSAWHLLSPLRQADPLFPPRSERAHHADVYQLAVSPDGRLVASAGRDGTVRVRPPGGVPAVLRGHRGEVNAVAFDPTGNRLASAGDDGTTRVWDLATGKQHLQLGGHTGEAVAVAFTPDGRTLVTAGTDGTVRQWRMPGGEPAGTIRASAGRIAALAMAPSGQQVATASKDGFVRVWDLASGGRQYERHLFDKAQCVAFAADGKTLAAGDAGGHLWLFGADDGNPLRLITCDNGCPVEGVAFAPDGKTLAFSGRHGRVRLWDLRLNELRRNLDCEDRRVWCVTYSADGQSLLAGAADGVIRTWSVADARPARYLHVPGGGVSVAYSPDGRTLAVAGFDGTVSFWDPRACVERPRCQRLRLQPAGRRLVRFDPAGTAVGVCGPDGGLQLWNLDGTPRSDRLPGPAGAPRSLCCRPGTAEWVACVDGGQLACWDVDRGGAAAVGASCALAAWSPDGTVLAAAHAGGVELLRNGTEKFADLRCHRASWEPPALAFSPDGATVAAVDYGGQVRLWQVAAAANEMVLETRQLVVRSLAFSPDGKVLASGGEGGTIKVWDVATGREMFGLTVRLDGAITAVAFAPDGTSMAAVSENYDGTRDVVLWPASRDNISTADEPDAATGS